MAQFDVFRLSEEQLVVDCQSNFLSFLHSRFVIPLLAPNQVDASAGLNPGFSITGEILHLFPQGAATVQTSDLRAQVSSLADHSYVILNAIDFLLTGV